MHIHSHLITHILLLLILLNFYFTSFLHHHSAVGSTKTILFGHAIQLVHIGSGKYLSCLGRSSAGELSLELGLSETPSGSTWFRVRAASQNKTDGEKVSFIASFPFSSCSCSWVFLIGPPSHPVQVCHNDEIYLVSEKEQRYIRVSDDKVDKEQFYKVFASFQRTKWSIVPYRPSDQAGESSSDLSGGDVIQIRLKQSDEFFSISPEDNFTDATASLYLQKQSNKLQIMQTLWQLELTKQRWSGSQLEASDSFRLKRSDVSPQLTI